jgi:hypothetical protein
MADMLADGETWLASQLKEHASQTVTYRRGGSSVVVQATIGRTEFESTSDDGATILVSRSRDFLVAASDLVLSGNEVVPQRGDTIEEVVGATTVVHEVAPPSSAVPAWEWSGALRNVRRIHTKERT